MEEIRPRLNLLQVAPRRQSMQILLHKHQQHVVGRVDMPRRVGHENRPQIIPVLQLEEDETVVAVLGLYLAVRGRSEAGGEALVVLADWLDDFDNFFCFGAGGGRSSRRRGPY